MPLMGDRRVALLLLLFLSFVLVSLPQIKVVKAESKIYIRTDGTVEGTDKIRRDGNLYSFTGDINGSITVEKNNIVVDGAGYALEGSGRGISLTNRTNITVKNLEISSFQTGIIFVMSNNNTITNCTIIDNGIEHWGEGIYLVLGSSNNIISYNNITGNYYGIRCFVSPSNIISENCFTKNKAYALLFDSSGITVVHNNITDNNIGIVISGVNIVYNNNFMDNIVHAICDPSVHNSTWDNGYSGGGNYWSDYNGTDANSDGIGDTPYVIYKSNQDNYPLMEPVPVIPEFPSWIILPLLLTVTLVIMVGKQRLPKHQTINKSRSY